MSTTHAGVFGFAPKVLVAPVVNPEVAKYQKMWGTDAYRVYSPGEHAAQTFMSVAALPPGANVIDFGTGTGRGALQLALFGRVRVTMVDFAENCLDPELQQALTTQAHALSFVLADLERPLPVAAKYGFCCDVMEHIPEEKVDDVLRNILKAAQNVFFQISTVQDACGAAHNETLHMTVRPFEWWASKLRDLEATIFWSAAPDESTACFYVSAWNPASALVEIGGLNTELDVLWDHMQSALKRPVKHVHPHQMQDVTISLLAGGPSLAQHWDEIKEKHAAGQRIVTVNGAYNAALAQGLRPSATVMVDAREFNKRFVEPAVPECKYLLGSQCHPSVFDAVPAEQIYLWHTPVTQELSNKLGELLDGTGTPWFPVPGGSTVTLRALSLLRILGFRRFEIYGFDSCLMDDAHHAYEQPENDNERSIVRVSCGDRVFLCHPWMASQAQEFLDQMQHLLLDEVELVVHGDGLIAHILNTGAVMAQDQE